jgi:hypothetical protein
VKSRRRVNPPFAASALRNRSMKTQNILIFGFFLIICSLYAAAQDPAFPERDRKVTTVYNDKTDSTVVRFGPMHLKNFTTNSPHSYAIEDGELRVSAFFTYKGHTLVKPQSIGLIFLSVNVSSNRWEISRQKDMEITADDEHWNIADVQVVNSQKSTELVVDSLGVSLPCEVFAKIANAKKAKFRLGDRRFDLDKEQFAAFRDLAKHAGC